MAGTCADHGPAGSGTRAPSRQRIRASRTAARSRDPARSRSVIASARTWAGSRPVSSAPRRVRHSHRAWWLVPRWCSAGRRRRQQVSVALLAGRGGFGGPDRVQQGQVVGVGEGLLAGLGGRVLVAVTVQHPGQHPQRRAGRSGRGGRGTNAVSFGLNVVIAGQLGSRTRAGHRVRPLGGGREHVRVVDVGAAGQRDVAVLAVLGPGDHRQAGVHRPALSDMIGDRVPQFGVTEILVQESAVGPPPLPGLGVGVQGAAHDQPRH